MSLLGTLFVMAGLIGVMLPRLKSMRSRQSTMIGLCLLAVGLALHLI